VVVARPKASLRAIASEAGASPETVRRVRTEIELESSEQGGVGRSPAATALPPRLAGDTALASTEQGQAFARWFERFSVSEDDWLVHVAAVPLSRVYEIADETRRRAECWIDFAKALEARTKR
jgi:hypothetical protein